MKCSRNLVLIAYVKSSKPLPTFVRKVYELNGKVINVNEEIRRVLSFVPQVPLEPLRTLLSEFASSYSVIFRIVCENVDPSCLKERLIKNIKAKAWAKVYYVSVENCLLVSIELRGNKAVLKLGRGSLVIPPPPSLFHLSLEEVESALVKAEDIVKLVVDGCVL